MQHITRDEIVFVAATITAIGNDTLANTYEVELDADEDEENVRYSDATECLENAAKLMHKLTQGEDLTIADARTALLNYETEWRDAVVEMFAAECVDKGKEELVKRLGVFIDDAACDKFISRYKEMA